jgi:hypothetical protein
MDDWNYTLSWYHGSQQELTTLRIGSSITQNRDIARLFSHRPAYVSMEDNGTFKHSGTARGYLYIIDEEVKAEDIYPHPHPINASKWEWLTKRELKVRFLERSTVREAERLTEADLAELRRRQQTAGAETFAA